MLTGISPLLSAIHSVGGFAGQALRTPDWRFSFVHCKATYSCGQTIIVGTVLTSGFRSHPLQKSPSSIEIRAPTLAGETARAEARQSESCGQPLLDSVT